MSNLLLKSIGPVLKALFLPAVVFGFGALIMNLLSKHSQVTKQLRVRADPEDRKPLYMRFRGYDAAEVDRHWRALDHAALKSEQRFLQLDLAFPLFYGAALAVALLRTRAVPGQSLSPLLLLGPVVATMIADWVENAIQLTQLQHYVESGEAGLHSGHIQLASMATIVKLYSFCASCLLLIWMTVYTVIRPEQTISRERLIASLRHASH